MDFTVRNKIIMTQWGMCCIDYLTVYVIKGKKGEPVLDFLSPPLCARKKSLLWLCRPVEGDYIWFGFSMVEGGKGAKFLSGGSWSGWTYNVSFLQELDTKEGTADKHASGT